ncbi:MAG TPA: zinc-dependent metalloprotease [Kofleriaceae bacterium]|nr:zinc-dependent metalloprotease [Kofleriaceae bacterium]
MFKRATVLAAICSVWTFGCSSEPQPGSPEERQEIIDNLVQAGYPIDDIMVVDGQVFVGRDAHVTLEASREMIESVASGEEQYRTNNLVGTGVTKICVVPTAAFDSYSRLSAGLDLAIANYNGLGLRLTFARGSASDCTATISARTTSGTGGSAGFPKGGKPYGTINIGTGLQSYSDDVNEHVITHELGHCIGFRHSDYYNRAISCGSGGNEGEAGVGAVLIPGTPSTASVGGSIMNSCFRSNESGEWSNTDKVALDYMY